MVGISNLLTMAGQFDVDSFLRSLHETKPPYECPKCKKIYKSFVGMEHHLHHFDHTASTPTSASTAKPPSSITRRNRIRFSKKRKSRPIQRSPSPIEFTSPARDTLTWAEAQRMVEVESEGKIYRLIIVSLFM